MRDVQSGTVEKDYAAFFAVNSTNEELLKTRERTSAVGVVFATIKKPVLMDIECLKSLYSRGYGGPFELSREEEREKV